MKNYIQFSFILLFTVYTVSLSIFVISQIKIISGIAFLGLLLSFILIRGFVKKYIHAFNLKIDHEQPSLSRALGIDSEDLTRKMGIIEKQLNDYSQKNNCTPSLSRISELLHMHLNEAEILSIATYQLQNSMKIMVVNKETNESFVKSVKDFENDHCK